MTARRYIDVPADVEASAWLRQAAARRVRELPPMPCPTVAPLGPPSTHGTREDRTCDRCRTYVPPTRPGRPVQFFTATYTLPHPVNGAPVLLTFGMCRPCMTHEVGDRLDGSAP